MKVFLDVGAHIGETLEVALEDKYGFDRIYCFDPIPENCAVLRTFSDKRITVCPYGLWNVSCSQPIYAPSTSGASLFKDKFNHPVKSRTIKLVDVRWWFVKNLKASDRVYLKLNCEGAECAILDRLITTGQYKKITVLMVDFDVRKIPSQKHLMSKIIAKLQRLGLPRVFYIDKYHFKGGDHRYFTRFWLDRSQTNKSRPSFINVDDTIT